MPSYSISYSSDSGPFAAKYPSLAKIPFILDTRPGFHRLGNAYLSERFLGTWDPYRRGDGPSSRIPTRQTMRSYAEWLANFLEWAELRGIELASCNYGTHVAGRYQTEMLSGTWARGGKPLRARTANLRVQQACDFLTWLFDRGHRDAFTIPYHDAQVQVGSATSSVGHYARQVKVRDGKAPEPQKKLRMPSNHEIRDWLGSIHEAHGETALLLCQSILLTAMRRAEVAGLRQDTLPLSRSDWYIPNPTAPPHQQQVRISIKYGTKGPSFGEDHGDKIGPERQILIPLSLAERWNEYRRTERNLAFNKWMKSAPVGHKVGHARDCVHLFLDEGTGKRFTTPQGVYRLWTNARLPIRGWSPHDGRDWWACSVLWREMKKQPQTTGQGDIPVEMLSASALSVIRLQIQPQLGHANESTTLIYLRWVIEMLGTPVSIDDDELSLS